MTPISGSNISLLKMFSQEDLTNDSIKKKNNESNVVHASEVIGGSPLYESIVSIGKSAHRMAIEITEDSPTLS